MPNIDDGNELELDVDDLFKDPEDEPVEEPENDSNKPDTPGVSKRINEVRSKAERDTQERIAKEFGYESYAAMQKAKEDKLLKDAGLDDEDTKNAINELVEKRLADDPRLKKLQEYEEQEKLAFVQKQLSEINKIPGVTKKYTSLDQLPPETLALWEKTGNLKQAYLATQGEELITGNTSKSTGGSLDHLALVGGSGIPTKTRRLTAEEKALYRSVDPDISDEELEKKTINI